MHFLYLILLATFSIPASAKECTDLIVKVPLSARQGVFNIAIPQTHSQVIDFVLNITQQGRNFTDVALTGYQTTSGTYNISARFCKPSVDPNQNPSIQILTHGIGFDKTYWDLPSVGGDSSYSYIDLATDTYKYYTLSYDRLGLGNSSHGDPLNEIQAPIEVAVLQALSSLLRSGTFPGVNQAFSKISHIGHSFGSILSYTFADQNPELSDALVLTGLSFDIAFIGLFAAGGNFALASENEHARFGDLPDGYLVSSDKEALKYLFMKPGFYDDKILELAGKTKQTVTLGEILTLLSLPSVNQFTGPVMVITGGELEPTDQEKGFGLMVMIDSDLPFCGSNCSATAGYDPTLPSIPAAVKNSFPNVAACNFTAYIQPNMGHGNNLHYNATGANTVILDFLNNKGLNPS